MQGTNWKVLLFWNLWTKIFLVDILLKENRLAFMNKCKRENRENINPALFNQFGPSVFRCKKQNPGLYFNWAWTDEIYLVVLETSNCVFSWEISTDPFWWFRRIMFATQEMEPKILILNNILVGILLQTESWQLRPWGKNSGLKKKQHWLRLWCFRTIKAPVLGRTENFFDNIS